MHSYILMLQCKWLFSLHTGFGDILVHVYIVISIILLQQYFVCLLYMLFRYITQQAASHKKLYIDLWMNYHFIFTGIYHLLRCLKSQLWQWQFCQGFHGFRHTPPHFHPLLVQRFVPVQTLSLPLCDKPDVQWVANNLKIVHYLWKELKS